MDQEARLAFLEAERRQAIEGEYFTFVKFLTILVQPKEF